MRDLVVLWLNHRRENARFLSEFDFKFFRAFIDQYKGVDIGNRYQGLVTYDRMRMDWIINNLITMFSIKVIVSDWSRNVIWDGTTFLCYDIIKYE